MSWFPSLWTTSDPIAAPMREFQQAALDAGIGIRITSTRRSAEQQRRLYAKGRTEPGPVVTWTLNSAHVTGRAFDITLEGAPEYEDWPEAWDALGELGQDLGLRWGGTYGDFGHFELAS